VVPAAVEETQGPKAMYTRKVVDGESHCVPPFSTTARRGKQGQRRIGERQDLTEREAKPGKGAGTKERTGNFKSGGRTEKNNPQANPNNPPNKTGDGPLFHAVGVFVTMKGRRSTREEERYRGF